MLAEMAAGEQRITEASHPVVRLEHALRYRAAAPLVLAGDTWCDLGCGTGVSAAAAALGYGGRVVLVDNSVEALTEAAQRVRGVETVTVAADLATEEGLAAVAAALGGADDVTVTCLGVLEQLDPVEPLVEFLAGLARDHSVTVALSVPAELEELLELLPTERVVARQLTLSGSWIARDAHEIEFSVHPEQEPAPTTFIVAFGARADTLASPAEVRVVDADAP
jgi:2-polyprenyl-3-methyl-5-hydroxy-6-metoxy-1,4-benzoquinol methylase